MDVAKTVATYLANAGFGTLGTDIFIGQIPDTKQGFFVVRTGGQMNNYVPIEESVVDIYYKGQFSETAIQELEAVKRYIHRMHNTELGQDYIYSFLVIGDVEDVQRDLQYEKIYKITVQVTHRDKTLIS